MSSNYQDASPTSGGAIEAIDMDPSSGASFFNSDYKKNADLKQMLDSSKDSLKLEAMKRIIGMVARGRDASDLFPAVVKNVVSKNIEVKKLVYVYLTRYAEEQQDLALLSISTFQRALKDPNQLIRASALRVLSSIRVPVIVPIVMLAIRDSSVDMSPFVRKTAAHAIPKLYSLDPDQKEELVTIIEKLLGDRTTLVVGSAVMAYEEVCPERIELIHKNFRKLNNLLVDVEEWGQVVIVNMLTRYARTQFVDPNLNEDLDLAEEDKEFYENSDEEDEAAAKKKSKARMDSDHRLLLRSTKPLLQSRNASVVMAVAQLYHHCAPKPEVQVVAKALIRLLRSHREVQAIVLNCIASMTSQRARNMFEPFLRNFFVRGSDPTPIKILKLEIITNLATEGNIGIVLREFQSYITGQDKICVAATIQAIGRCAASITEVTDTCLNGLVHLLSNRDQAVVAESVVVIKKLLQTQAGDHKEIIIHMAKLVDSIEVPAARAAILWVLGEYSDRVPKIAPDVLRKMAKNFTNEKDQVKLQILNLSVKLCLTNPKQTKLLTQYIFNLAKYDQNYDIRDRARFMRVFLFPPPGHENNKLIKHAKKIFLAPKPAPLIESRFKDRDVYQLGSMSHFLNTRVHGYHDLPEFPASAPDPSVRNVEPPRAPNTWENSEITKEIKKRIKKREKKAKAFFSESEEESGSGSGSSSEGSGTSDSEESSSGSESDSEGSEESETETTIKQKNDILIVTTTATPIEKKPPPPLAKKDDSGEDSDSDSSSSEASSSDSDSDDEPVKQPPPKAKSTNKSKSSSKPSAPQSNLDLLLDLSGDATPSIPTPTMTPSLGGFLSPMHSATASSPISDAAAMFVPSASTELLNKMSTGGLRVSYRFTRSANLFSSNMCNIELTLTNDGSEDLTDIKVGAKHLPPGLTLHEFPGISKLPVGSSQTVTIGVNYNDSTQAAGFDLISSGQCHKVTLQAPVGELVRAVSMPESHFLSEVAKLRGMNETTLSVNIPSANADDATVKRRVYEVANVLQVPSSNDDLRFAGSTLTEKSLVLATIRRKGGSGTQAELAINCEKMVIASMLAKEIKMALEK